MNEKSNDLHRSERFRTAIAAFIDGRREAKLKGKDDPAADAAATKYEYRTWLADAVRRVTQIQVVTHVLKATHPEARGTNLHAAPDSLPQHTEVGTHTLGAIFAEDVVGNAAALDVFKFLKTEVDGLRLIDWMRSGDEDLLSALHPDATTATAWMQAFSDLVRNDTMPTSHEAAKQIYWLVETDPSNDAHYHLLQPLFSSSLTQAVHADIQEARFGEQNKEARQAYLKKEEHGRPYRNYHNLVVRKLGGAKPQNISQLNSERGGMNYLLASLPPIWVSTRLPSLLEIDTAMERFAWFGSVRDRLKELSNFLLSDPDPTMKTRTRREGMEQVLAASLPVFADEVQRQLGPGWTRDPRCRLPMEEKLWLDPQRIELPSPKEYEQDDAAFTAAYHHGDWPDQMASRFANWLNTELRNTGLIEVGDAEYKHWAKQAIVDAAWPVPMLLRTPPGGNV